MKLILGGTYQVTRNDGTFIIFIFWGDQGNVTDAVEIINSNIDMYVGTKTSLDVLLGTPYIHVLPV